MPFPPAELTFALGRFVQTDGFGLPVDPDEARRRADDVLSRAEYREPGKSFLDHVLGWLGERLSGLLFQSGTSGIQNLISYLLLGAMLGFVGWVVYKSVRMPGRSHVTAGESVSYGTESIRDPQVWLAEAAALAATGDFRGALRCRHQALIASWIVGDVIDHVVGRTAQECHDAALERIDPAASRRVVARFDGVWYGNLDVTAPEYEAFAADCDRLATVPSRRSRAGADA